VDHPLAAPDALIRPWRNALFIAATVAIVELVLLVGIGGRALLVSVADRVERDAVKRAQETKQQPAKRVTRQIASVPAKLPRAKTRVLVLNGNGRQGAASSAAGRVELRGYRIRGVANAPRSDFARSIVMYRPGFAGEWRRFGQDLHVSAVSPLDGMRVRELQGAHIVFILGN
jgi:LytR cell envelope-related transcriptional attenuator